jgi:hypothetical protein
MLDLKSQYGKVYRVGWDESASIPGQSNEDRRWLQVAIAKYGHIGIHSHTELGVYVRTYRDSSDRLGRLLALPGARLKNRGDAEAIVVIPNDQFEAAAEIIHARKRRQISEGNLAKLSAANAPFRFRPGHGVGASPGDQIRDGGTQDVLEAIPPRPIVLSP